MKKLNTVLAEVLQIKEETIVDSTSPGTIDSWDSYNGLLLVSELENNFKVKFTLEEVMAVKNVGDIKKFLEKHGIKIEQYA